MKKEMLFFRAYFVNERVQEPFVNKLERMPSARRLPHLSIHPTGAHTCTRVHKSTHAHPVCQVPGTHTYRPCAFPKALLLSLKGRLTQGTVLDAPTLTLTGDSSCENSHLPQAQWLSHEWTPPGISMINSDSQTLSHRCLQEQRTQCVPVGPTSAPDSVCKSLLPGLTFFSQLPQNTLLSAPSSVGQKSDRCYWVLCSGSHEADCQCVGAFRCNSDHCSNKQAHIQ